MGEPGQRADRRPDIADYGFLSDCHSAVLVDRSGSVDWWCAPRFDSPSVLGRLLDPAAGHWVLTPAETCSSERSYLGDTSLLDAVTSPRTFPVNLTAVRAGVLQVSRHCQLAASGRHDLFRGLRTPCPAAGTSSVTHRHGFRSDRLSCRRTRYSGSACEKGE